MYGVENKDGVSLWVGEWGRRGPGSPWDPLPPADPGAGYPCVDLVKSRAAVGEALHPFLYVYFAPQ